MTQQFVRRDAEKYLGSHRQLKVKKGITVKNKRFISVLPCFCIMLCLKVPAYAVETDQAMINSSERVINEFTEAKRLAEMPSAKLEAMGYKSEEIAEIRSYREVFIDHVTQLNKKTDEVLKAVGYSDEQIDIIRSFTGTDAELVASSASVTLSASGHLEHRCEEEHHVVGTLSYYWTWSGIPAFKGHDEIAVAWNDWECVDSYGYVYYYSSSTGQEYGTPGEVEVDEGDLETRGIGHRFNMRNGIDPYYAKSGGGTFYVQTDIGAYGLVKDMNYYIAYGHSQLNFSGDISFSLNFGLNEEGGIDVSGGGAINFTPSYGTRTVAELKNRWLRCQTLGDCDF